MKFISVLVLIWSYVRLLPLFHGKIEGNRSKNIFAIFEISKKSDCNIETRYNRHACIKNSVPASHISRRFHLIFKRQNYPNSFKRIYCCSKIKRILLPRNGRIKISKRRLYIFQALKAWYSTTVFSNLQYLPISISFSFPCGR